MEKQKTFCVCIEDDSLSTQCHLELKTSVLLRFSYVQFRLRTIEYSYYKLTVGNAFTDFATIVFHSEEVDGNY